MIGFKVKNFKTLEIKVIWARTSSNELFFFFWLSSCNDRDRGEESPGERPEKTCSKGLLGQSRNWVKVGVRHLVGMFRGYRMHYVI